MLRRLFILTLSLLTLSGCQTFSEEGELVYLNADTTPPLEIPEDTLPTTSRTPFYPIPEGERQTPAEGTVSPFPPDGLKQAEKTPAE